VSIEVEKGGDTTMVDFLAMTGQTQTKNMRNLRGIATPWILGLYSVAAATFIVGTRWAGWYSGSGSESQFLLLPFATALGGITLLAAFWAFLASDGLATAMLGTWGSFWVAYGVLNALFASGRLTRPAGEFTELGFWFIALGAITWMGAAAAMAENVALGATLAFLAAGSTIAAIGNLVDRPGLMMVAGWLCVISAVLGWYTASGMMFEATFSRPVLPLGQVTATSPRSAAGGEPGAVVGQAPAARRAG